MKEEGERERANVSAIPQKGLSAQRMKPNSRSGHSNAAQLATATATDRLLAWPMLQVSQEKERERESGERETEKERKTEGVREKRGRMQELNYVTILDKQPAFLGYDAHFKLRLCSTKGFKNTGCALNNKSQHKFRGNFWCRGNLTFFGPFFLFCFFFSEAPSSSKPFSSSEPYDDGSFDAILMRPRP